MTEIELVESDCPICLEPLVGEAVGGMWYTPPPASAASENAPQPWCVMPSCGHGIHTDCIQRLALAAMARASALPFGAARGVGIVAPRLTPGVHLFAHTAGHVRRFGPNQSLP